MLTDDERTELHDRLQAIQRDEERRLLSLEQERSTALGSHPRQLEPGGPPVRMR